MTMFVGGAIVVGGLVAANSAEKARKSAVSAGDSQLSESQRQFDLTQEQTKPYRETGKRALTMLEDMTSGNYDVAKTPGYQFRLNEGYKGVERSQAGRRLSGRAVKEMARYGQDYASSEYNNEFNRLSQMANYGVSGTAQAIQGGNAASAGINNAYGNIGNANAAGASNTNDAIQGTAQNLTMWNMYNTPSTGSYYSSSAPASAVAAGDAYQPAYAGP